MRGLFAILQRMDGNVGRRWKMHGYELQRRDGGPTQSFQRIEQMKSGDAIGLMMLPFEEEWTDDVVHSDVFFHGKGNGVGGVELKS